ncbi:hypothetical protein D3C81_1856650 [compost metagenome]
MPFDDDRKFRPMAVFLGGGFVDDSEWILPTSCPYLKTCLIPSYDGIHRISVSEAKQPMATNTISTICPSTPIISF